MDVMRLLMERGVQGVPDYGRLHVTWELRYLMIVSNLTHYRKVTVSLHHLPVYRGQVANHDSKRDPALEKNLFRCRP